MKVRFNKEILEYIKQNKEAKGILTSCKEILIPYILENHEESLHEYIELSDIEFINIDRATEINVLNIDRLVKIRKVTFKDIEKELIQPLFNSLKNSNLEYTLKIECDLYVANEVESVFSGCWKEFRITNYSYQEKLVCPSLSEY